MVLRFMPPLLTPLMVIRAVQGERGPGRDWVPLARVSPALLRAVIAAEDARFFTHYGFDVSAIRRARAFNARHPGRRPRGASTITMQCARNVFLWPGGGWVRKVIEAYFAGLLELLWGKRRILEVYLNVIEWGGGLYGVEAAARTYFRIPASALDARQAALLAAALPNPRRWNPAGPTAYLAARARVIQARAARIHLALSVS
jgi:monofunctional biosynthetic peptidoglycan transglycosylase